MSINKNILRGVLLEDFTRYLRWSFKQKYNSKIILKDFHIEICEALISVYNNETKNLIINMPPRSGKTEIINTFIEWTLTKHPESKYIMTSYSDTLVSNSSQSIRDMFNSYEHKDMFNIETKKDSQSKKLWKTTNGGGVYAVSSFGQITGHGAGLKKDGWGGCIVIDDPLKPSEANSLTQLDKIQDWYQTTLSNRKNKPDTPIIIIMQRLHTEDLVGVIESNKFKDLGDWKIIKIKMFDEETEKSRWEEFYPRESLIKIKESNPSYFNSQFQQEPIVKGGNRIKYDWFKWWKVLPNIDYILITVDTAQKTKEINDYTVMQCWGVSKDKDIYLLDMIRGKFEAPQLRQTAKTFYKKWDDNTLATLRKMYIEDKSSGSSLIQDLKAEKMKIGAVQRNTDKVFRCDDLSPHIEAGRVYLNEDISHIQDLIDESLSFPNGKHDDTIDPMLDAIDIGIVKSIGSGLNASMF